MKSINTIFLLLLLFVNSSWSVAKDYADDEVPFNELSLLKNKHTEGLIIEDGIIRLIKSDLNGIKITTIDTLMGERKVMHFNGNDYAEDTQYFNAKGSLLFSEKVTVSVNTLQPENINKVGCGNRSAALIAAINAYDAAVEGGDAETIEIARQLVEAAISAWLECVAF